jgi:hypothetical protein
MPNVAPGENGIKAFFFDLLSYPVESLEGAIPGMEGQLESENGEAFKHVILVCKDLIARKTSAAGSADNAEEKEEEMEEDEKEEEQEEKEMEAEEKEEEEMEVDEAESNEVRAWLPRSGRCCT